MEKLKKVFEWMKNSNHFQHVIGMFLLAFAFVVLSAMLGQHTFGTIFQSLFLVLSVSICMEYKDKVNGGVFDVSDIFADLAGWAIALLTYLLLIVIL